VHYDERFEIYKLGWVVCKLHWVSFQEVQELQTYKGID